MFDAALFFSRVPDRQQTVKLSGLHTRGGTAQSLRHALEPEEIGPGGRPGDQREVPVAARSPFAHRQVLGDALLLFEPGDRVALAPDLVDEPEGHSLPAAEDLAGRGGRKFALVQAPALADQ